MTKLLCRKENIINIKVDYEKKDFVYYGFTKDWWSRKELDNNIKHV